jgi:hypothetical protein
MTNFGSNFWGGLLGLKTDQQRIAEGQVNPYTNTPYQQQAPITQQQLDEHQRKMGIDMLHPLGPWDEVFGGLKAPPAPSPTDPQHSASTSEMWNYFLQSLGIR